MSSFYIAAGSTNKAQNHMARLAMIFALFHLMLMKHLGLKGDDSSKYPSSMEMVINEQAFLDCWEMRKNFKIINKRSDNPNRICSQ